MKLEQDLRIVIKAAAEASKRNFTRWESANNRKAAVDAFLKKFPTKALRVAKLTKDHENATKLVELCEQKMVKEFGLSLSKYHGDKIENEANFQKAGGVIPKTEAFSFEQVVTEYAAAKNKSEAVKVLGKFGIVWE